MSSDGDSPDSSSFMERIHRESSERVEMIHVLAKKIWKGRRWTPEDLQNKCQEAWDSIGSELQTRIKPLVTLGGHFATNLIFGSGSFSTGRFQAAQYRRVAEYAKPPVFLQGLVTNRSAKRGCNAAKVSQEFAIPLVELDFSDWYHEYVDENEPNPIQASRYWFPKGDPKRPPQKVLAERFEVRQGMFHEALGERIEASIHDPTDIASARGYSFQFCSNIFKDQKRKPHVNDTHPADLTYVNPGTKEKMYPGWQASPIQSMLRDGHKIIRGSLIEVGYMDRVGQIDELDEGALLAIGGGVSPDSGLSMSAEEIQTALKVMDDYVFCTLEPTGLLLAWGISEKPMKVTYQDIEGNPVEVEQRIVLGGDKIRSGENAWGSNLKRDLADLERFLLSD